MKKDLFKTTRRGLALCLSVSMIMSSAMISFATDNSTAISSNEDITVTNYVSSEEASLEVSLESSIEASLESSDASSTDDTITEEADDSSSDSSLEASSLDESTEDASTDEASTDDSAEDASSEASSEDLSLISIDESKNAVMSTASANLLANSNQIGDNITFTFSGDTLTITGTGSTYDYTYSNAPFYGYTNIKSIVIGEGITRIGSNLFSGTGRYSGSSGTITSVSLPKTLTELAPDALSGLNSDKLNLVIPGSVTFMGERALGCYAKTITLSEGITKIDKNAFKGLNCQGLTLPQSLETIDEYGLANADIYTTLTIPKNVKHIGDCAFQSIRRTDTITFTGNLPTFGNDCFIENYIIGYYPAGNSTWSSSAIASLTKKFGEITWRATGSEVTSGKCGDNITWAITSRGNLGGNKLTLSGYGPMYDYSPNNQAPWSGARQHIDEISMDDRITTVGDYAFYDVSTTLNPTSHLSTSLTRVGKYAFYETSLSRTNLPASITYFDDYCFYRCVYFNGTGATINPATTYIGDYAFYGCQSLEATLPAFTKLEKISPYAFHGCLKLKGTIQLPDTMTYIGENAFSSCSSITGSIKLPKNLEYLGKGAFQNDPKLGGEVVINSKLTEIPSYAFAQSGFTKITVGDNITKIDSSAFSLCPSLKTVVLGKNVTSIPSWLFKSDSALQEVIFNGDVTTIGTEAFLDCTSLKKLALPESVTSLSRESFKGCTALTDINFPAALTTISSSCFKGCTGLQKINLGDNVTTISDSAFYGCSSLKEISFGTSFKSIGTDAFNGTAITKYTFNGEKPYTYTYSFRGAKANPTVYFYNKYLSWTDVTAQSLKMADLNPTLVGLGDFTYYTVEFYIDGKLYYSEKVKAGQKVHEPQPPVKEHYVFRYWVGMDIRYIYDSFENRTITSDLKVEAYYGPEPINITFKLMNGEPDIVRTGYYGNSFSSYTPNYPSKEGYGFYGWSFTEPTEDNVGERISSNYTLTKDITVYARFTKPTRKITFVTNCDTEIEPVEANFESYIYYTYNSFYYDLTKDGYSLDGWYYDKDFTKPVNSNDFVTKDITIYLKWKRNTYRVYFYCNGADNFKSPLTVEVTQGEPVAAPDIIPHIEGYTFQYWEHNSEEYDFSEPVNETLYLYAIFKDINDWGDVGYYTRNKMGFTTSADIPDGIWVYGMYDLPYSGSKITQSPSVYYKNKLLEEKVDYTLSYVNNVNAGTATMKITLKGNLSGSATETFTIDQREISYITGKERTYTYQYNGKVQKFKETFKYGKAVLKLGKDYELEYVGLDKEGAFKNPGTYQVIIRGIGNYTGSVTETMKITDATPMSKAKVSGILNKSYTGSEITQDAINVTIGGKQLTNHIDYEVEYDNNVYAGTATLYIVAKEGSSYHGYKAFTFKITGTDISKAKVNIFNPNRIYNGEVQNLDAGTDFEVIMPKTKTTPEKVLKGIYYLKAREMSKAELAQYDYKYYYSYRSAKGTASFIIDGINQYSGSKKASYTIKAKPLTSEDIKIDVYDCTYTKGGVAPYVRVEDANYPYVYEGSSYTVTYSANKKAGIGTAKITGKGNYTGTVTRKFTISKCNINRLDIKLSDVQVNKTGKYKPTVTIKDSNGKALTNGSDYKYVVNGTTVTITGKGNYEGEKTLTFRVYDNSISKAKVVTQSRNYTGFEINDMEKDMVVTLGDKTLVYKKDFRIVGYSNNIKAGTAKVTIRGIGDYGGTKTVTFKIIKAKVG